MLSLDADSLFVTVYDLFQTLAEDSDSSVSSGSVIVRRSRRAGHIVDSNVSDTSSGSDSDDANADADKNEGDEATSSDSGDDQAAERCPICLRGLRKQEVGVPESCDHTFCKKCIIEWSKSLNTCPYDRKKFNLILVRPNYSDQNTIETIDVPEPNGDPYEGIQDYLIDFTSCEICGRSNDEDRLLLCDGCDLAFHLYCLDPPLAEVPAGNWYCHGCISNGRGYVNISIDQQFSFEVDLRITGTGRGSRSQNQNRRNTR